MRLFFPREKVATTAFNGQEMQLSSMFLQFCSVKFHKQRRDFSQILVFVAVILFRSCFVVVFHRNVARNRNRRRRLRRRRGTEEGQKKKPVSVNTEREREREREREPSCFCRSRREKEGNE